MHSLPDLDVSYCDPTQRADDDDDGNDDDKQAYFLTTVKPTDSGE